MSSMQALAHVQGRIRAHRVRMSEEGLAVQHQMWQRGQPVSRKASVRHSWMIVSEMDD
jgi:translation initiation factor IF-1